MQLALILIALLLLPVVVWSVGKVKNAPEAASDAPRGTGVSSSNTPTRASRGEQGRRAAQIPSDPQERALADRAIRQELWGEAFSQGAPTTEQTEPSEEFVSRDAEVTDTRRERIERAKRRELVRAALRSTAGQGYYVFDEIMTEDAGMLDYLAVGPLDLLCIVVREDTGVVTASPSKTQLFIDGQRFDDDPFKQAEDLKQDVMDRVFSGQDYLDYFVCFTNARLAVDENNKYPWGTTPLMDLAWALDPNGEPSLTPADIEDIAERVEAVYGRPPFVRPTVGEES